VVQAGADWWVLVEASLRYACSPANRKSPFKGVEHTSRISHTAHTPIFYWIESKRGLCAEC
jgi:hypothetical protein